MSNTWDLIYKLEVERSKGYRSKKNIRPTFGADSKSPLESTEFCCLPFAIKSKLDLPVYFRMTKGNGSSEETPVSGTNSCYFRSTMWIWQNKTNYLNSKYYIGVVMESIKLRKNSLTVKRDSGLDLLSVFLLSHYGNVEETLPD